MLDFKEKNKMNFQVSARRAFFDSLGTALVMGLIISIIIQLAKVFLPESFQSILSNKYIYFLLLAYIIYEGFKKYFRIKRYLDISDVISDIRRDDYPTSSFKSYILSYENSRNIAEKKLDLLKLFTPIPILIYLFGIYVDNKPILNRILEFGSYNISLNEALMYIGVGAIFTYIYFLKTIFTEYKSSSNNFVRFQSGLLEHEEKIEKRKNNLKV